MSIMFESSIIDMYTILQIHVENAFSNPLFSCLLMIQLTSALSVKADVRAVRKLDDMVQLLQVSLSSLLVCDLSTGSSGVQHPCLHSHTPPFVCRFMW